MVLHWWWCQSRCCVALCSLSCRWQSVRTGPQAGGDCVSIDVCQWFAELFQWPLWIRCADLVNVWWLGRRSSALLLVLSRCLQTLDHSDFDVKCICNELCTLASLQSSNCLLSLVSEWSWHDCCIEITNSSLTIKGVFYPIATMRCRCILILTRIIYNHVPPPFRLVCFGKPFKPYRNR